MVEGFRVCLGGVKCTVELRENSDYIQDCFFDQEHHHSLTVILARVGASSHRSTSQPPLDIGTSVKDCRERNRNECNEENNGKKINGRPKERTIELDPSVVL